MVSQELQNRIAEYAERSRAGMVEELKALVRIPSVSRAGADGLPFGRACAQVLEEALRLAEGHGLTAQSCGGYYGLAQYGAGDKTIGLFSHLDVVPEGNNWINSPYEPVEKDGLLIGRGVADNKNAAVVSMYVMKAFRELGLPLRSKISLFLGCSEETGMEDIDRFVEEQPMPDFSIVPDASFPVCHGEKGIFSCEARCKTPWQQIRSLTGGTVGNMVPDAASAVVPAEAGLVARLEEAAAQAEGITVAAAGEEITVSATGLGAHAAQPQGGDNAIRKLCRFLADIPALAERDRAVCGFVAGTLNDCYGEALGIACQDEPSGRLTAISGVAETREGCLVVHYNIRYPVTHRGELVRQGLEKTFSAAGWSFTQKSDSAPIYLPADSPAVRVLSQVYADVTGKDATPYVVGGGTYARHLKNAVAFGMESEIDAGLPKGHGGVHEPDEAVRVDDLVEALRIYILSVLEIDEVLHQH